MRVYVAGPISSGDLSLNVTTAIDAAHLIREAGHVPFVPHLSFADANGIAVFTLEGFLKQWEADDV